MENRDFMEPELEIVSLQSDEIILTSDLAKAGDVFFPNVWTEE